MVTKTLEAPELTQLEEYEQELIAILDTLTSLDMALVGSVLETCMGLMGRCTEMHIELMYMELTDRKAKVLRTLRLKPVMELIEFLFKGGSRLTEVYRQEMELSR